MILYIFPFRESELSNCTFPHILHLFRLFRGDRSGMDKSSSVTCLLHSDVVKRGPKLSPTWLSNKGVGDFRFKNILQLFSIFFFQLLCSIIFFYSFLTHVISPHPRPTPTPTTHDPPTSTHYTRPTTLSHTQPAPYLC